MRTLITTTAATALFAGAALAASEEARGTVENFSNMDDSLTLESGETFIVQDHISVPGLKDGATVTIRYMETDEGKLAEFVTIENRNNTAIGSD